MGVDVAAEVEGAELSAAVGATPPPIQMDDLCKRVVEVQLMKGFLEATHLNRGSVLVANYDSAWRKRDLHHRTEATLADVKSRLQQANIILTTFRWVHEELLPAGCFTATTTSGGHIHTGGLKLKLRQPLLTDLQHKVHAILAMDAPIAAALEKQEGLEQGIVQRLKWAAGANPTLADVLKQFEGTQRSRQKVMDNEKNTSMEIVRLCNAILHFECFRSASSDAKLADAAFLELLQVFHRVAQLQGSCQTTVSVDEEALLKDMPMSDDTDADEWMRGAKDFAEISLESVREMKVTTALQLDRHRTSMNRLLGKIKLQLATHHKLMSEVRAILKNLAKYEEQIQGSDLDEGVRGYLSRYKQYSEEFSSLITSINSDLILTRGDDCDESRDQPPVTESSASEEVMQQIGEIIKSTLNLLQDTPKIYDNLVELAKPLLSLQTGVSAADDNKIDADMQDKNLSPQLSPFKRPSSMLLAPGKNSEGSGTLSTAGAAAVVTATTTASKLPVGSSNAAVSRDPRTGRALQERNSYAVNVWRRVKLKLEGRDPDPSLKTSV